MSGTVPVDDELAVVIHDAMCDRNVAGACPRWRQGDPHLDYYVTHARNLTNALAPEIGVANVVPVVRAVLEEVL